jgi:hypothetical protein
VGAAGPDAITFDTFDAPLVVGWNVTVSFGGGAPGSNNIWATGALTVGGAASFTGGSDADIVNFAGDSVVGGGVTFAAGGGGNSLDLGAGSHTAIIGGGLKFTGGAGIDGVRLDHLTVGRDAVLNLGAGVAKQVVRLGTRQAAPVVFGGNLTITTGEAGDDVRVQRTTVGKALTLTAGGGADLVFIDDTAVVGATLIDLGAGADELHVDTTNDDSNGIALDGVVQFGGRLTVMAGDGDDLVDLSKQTGDHVVGGGAVKLVGGTGQDTLKNYTGNFYLGTKLEDLELGDSF